MTNAGRGGRWSPGLASLLAGVGLLVLALSLIMMYVGRVLLSEDAFAERVSSSVENPQVSEFVALRLTDAVIGQQPDLTAFRPILVVVARGVVASDPFRALLRPAVRKIHQALLSSTAENILLAIPDAGELIHEALKVAGPSAAERVPATLQPLLNLEGVAPALTAAVGVLGAVEQARVFGRLGFLAAFLLLVAAILVSPVRRLTALSVSVGVATIGVALALVVPAGRLLFAAGIPDAAAAGAATGLWMAFFGPLRVIGIVVAVLGAALALVAVPGEELDASTIRQGVWEFLSRRRERALAETGRLFMIGAAGLLAVCFPALALSVAAVSGGRSSWCSASWAGGGLPTEAFPPSSAAAATRSVSRRWPWSASGS